MNRLILALAFAPALLTTGAFAQTVSEDVSKQLWCGEALVAAFSNPPPGVPSEQLTQAQVFIDGGNRMIDDAGQKYLDAGFTEEQLTKVKTDLVTEVTEVVTGNGANAKYSFDDCNAVLNGGSSAPADTSPAPADTSSSAAPASSSAAQSGAPRRLGAEDALVVVDIQYDFLPGGRLAVAGGDEIIAPVNRLARRFANVVQTQDWHPAGHISFASSHPGKAPFETIQLDYGAQVLWPDHCVIGSRGAEFAAGLELPNCQMIVRKGFHPEVDSYSGFREADRKTQTGLAGYLRERGFRRLFVVGLATDFCVSWTAEDAAAAGFETIVVEDLTRAIDTAGSLEAARARMQAAGVKRMQLSELG